MAIKDYSTDPDMNTTISGINIAEGCAPSGINNAIRQLMADVAANVGNEDEAGRVLVTDSPSVSQTAADGYALSPAGGQAILETAEAAAETAAGAAKAASEAQSTADSALEAANNITVPVTSVNGQTGAVQVGTVKSVNGVAADAAGNVALGASIKMPNYDAVVSVGNVTRTPSSDVVVHCTQYGSSKIGYITIGSYEFHVSKEDSNGYRNKTYRSFYIAAGTTYKTESLNEVLEIPLI